MMTMDVGDLVENVKMPSWGSGTIRKMSAAKVTVFFPDLAAEKIVLPGFLRITKAAPSARDNAFDHLMAILPRSRQPTEWRFELETNSWNGWFLEFDRDDTDARQEFIEATWREFSQINTRCFDGFVEKAEIAYGVCIVPVMPQMAIAKYAKLAAPLPEDERREIQSRLAEVFAEFAFEIVSAADDHVEAKFIAPLNDNAIAKKLRKMLPRCSDDHSENRLQASDLIADNGFRLNWWD